MEENSRASDPQNRCGFGLMRRDLRAFYASRV